VGGCISTRNHRLVPILDEIGNFDTYYAPDLPGRGRFHGLGLRLFDQRTGLWRIWWASTIGQGQLDTPLVDDSMTDMDISSVLMSSGDGV